jgi:hypothetical protein
VERDEWLCGELSGEGWAAKRRGMGGYAERDEWLSRKNLSGEGWVAMRRVMGGYAERDGWLCSDMGG